MVNYHKLITCDTVLELSVTCHSKRASISYVFSPVFGVQLLKTIVKKHWKNHCKSWLNNLYRCGHWNPFEIIHIYIFSRIFWLKEMRHDPFTYDHHNSIFKFLGGVIESIINIFSDKKRWWWIAYILSGPQVLFSLLHRGITPNHMI